MGDFLDSIWSPIRKYLIPDSMGGGHTEKEKEKIKEDYEKVKDKTWGDTAEDILGVDADKSLFVVAMVVFIFLAIKN
jgi:hypothetical protein